jgi:hypothetical protein
LPTKSHVNSTAWIRWQHCDGDINITEYSKGHDLLTLEGEPHPAEELPLARAVFHGETVMGKEMMVQRPGRHAHCDSR